MPAPQSGTPMTYMVNGRQFIIVAVSGGAYSRQKHRVQPAAERDLHAAGAVAVRTWRACAAATGAAVVLVALLAEGRAQNQPVLQALDHDPDLAGVIDLHAHSGPDPEFRPRLLNDIDLARLARRKGMRAIVLKNHYTASADRAELVMEEVGGIEVFGAVVLNRAVGGQTPTRSARWSRCRASAAGSSGCRPGTPNTTTRKSENRPSVPITKGALGRSWPGSSR